MALFATLNVTVVVAPSQTATTHAMQGIGSTTAVIKFIGDEMSFACRCFATCNSWIIISPTSARVLASELVRRQTCRLHILGGRTDKSDRVLTTKWRGGRAGVTITVLLLLALLLPPPPSHQHVTPRFLPPLKT